MFKIPRDKRSSAPKKNPTKKAFTLAEVMIVITIIGILSAILLPSAIHSTPDKNILKFKKAYNDFALVVRELANNGEKFTSGNIFLMPNGDKISDNTYFCNTFADYYTLKSYDCSYGSSVMGYTDEGFFGCYGLITNGEYCVDQYNAWDVFQADRDCINETKPYNLIAANDVHIGGLYGVPSCVNNPRSSNEYYLPNCHQIICIDIDGPDGPVKPFGFLLRYDGKILPAGRARWWLSRDITKKETECCPKELSSEGGINSSHGGVNFCDDGDTVCE